jgi:hypothetical protein
VTIGGIRCPRKMVRTQRFTPEPSIDCGDRRIPTNDAIAASFRDAVTPHAGGRWSPSPGKMHLSRNTAYADKHAVVALIVSPRLTAIDKNGKIARNSAEFSVNRLYRIFTCAEGAMMVRSMGPSVTLRR